MKRLVHKLGMIVLLALAAGCSRPVQEMDDAELADPSVKQAIEKERGGDEDGAIKAYQAALDRNPMLARAHLGIALLMDKPERDFLTAIYHYRRYLDLRPRTEKREMIDNRLRLAMQSLAASLGKAAPATPDRFAAMEAENAAMKMQIGDLEAELQRLRAASAAAPTAPPAAPTTPVSPPQPQPAPMVTSSTAGIGTTGTSGARPPSTPPARPRTYKVQPGDSLMRIAGKVYGDMKRWKDIFEANRDTMKTPQDVRYGQVIIIPR